ISMPFSEAAWLCLAVTAGSGGIILCKYKSPGQLGSWVVCLAALWGGACLLSLSLFWSLILFSLSCFLLYMLSSGQELLPVDGKAVLVTGSDSGFGHGLAKHLDKLGFTVFAGVLDENGSGAEELRRSCSKRLSVLQMDVTNQQQIKDVYSKVAEKVQDKGLWAVINNAGILSFPMEGELIPMADYKACMAVNFFGAVEVTKTFLPLLRKSKGRLVNISSTGGVFPMQQMAAYGSSKAALTMFSSVMRLELSKWGVKVSVIQPGGFRTSLGGTSESWDKKMQAVLDHLPPELQKDYGRDYILAQKNFLRVFQFSTNPDITPVMRVVEHAVSAKSPAAFYEPGRDIYMSILMASFVPTSVLDYFLKKKYTIVQPSVLGTPKNKGS
uniref:Hydroxysteroid 17-beta dehydrogenase 2 n=1 Tax=Sciurus vulgaris TaxID=55149 RepID=A0A8D2DWX5_SCIVU